MPAHSENLQWDRHPSLPGGFKNLGLSLGPIFQDQKFGQIEIFWPQKRKF
jgi:hypothetical protein